MAKTTVASVVDYLAKSPPHVRGALERVRSAIRKALPAAEEVISYSIPAYRLHGTVVIYFAGWKEHVSIYPATGQVKQVFKAELAPYEVSKGTIRFPLSEPAPVRLIAGIARLRAREAAERAAAKKTVATGAAPRRAKARPATLPARGVRRR